MVIILVNSAVPLLRDAGSILMMVSKIDSKNLKKNIESVKNVAGVHELHCWTFTQTKHVGHVHCLMRRQEDGQVDVDAYQ